MLLDDRVGVSPGIKFNDAELLGIPTIVVVGRGLADGVVEVKDRRSGERHDIPLGKVVAALHNTLPIPTGRPDSWQSRQMGPRTLEVPRVREFY